MRFHARAPVTWPSDAAWLAHWRMRWQDLERVEVDATGRLVPLDDEDRGDDEVEIRLLSGEHPRPGARYAMTFPGVTVLTAAAGIGGDPRRRLAHVQVRNSHHRGRVTLDLDSVDAFESVRAHSDMDHLAFDVTLQRSRAASADVDVRLDWLRVRATVRVEGPAGDEHLVVEGSLTGRRQWRPVLAPLLSSVGQFARIPMKSLATELARSLTDIAIDPTSGPLDPLQRRLRDVEHAGDIMVERANVIATIMADRSWWHRRRAKNWLRVLATMPPPQWPASEVLESWPKREKQLLRHYVRQHRDQPVTWLGEELMRREHHVPEYPPPAGTTADGPGPVPVPVAHEPEEITDEEFDLSWLATPWSTVRQLTGRTDQSDAETAASVRRELADIPRTPRWLR